MNSKKIGPNGKIELLNYHIEDHKAMGCVEKGLGIVNPPLGYAIMLNSDHTHYYWLRYDGLESCISCCKWAAYRGAKKDSRRISKMETTTNET